MSTTIQEIHDKSNLALDTLSNLWLTMLKVIEAVSAAAASSLTVEPDLAELQKIRREYEQLMSTLKANVEWLHSHPINDNELDQITDAHVVNEEEHQKLRKESERVNSQLKRLLNQSYALQFQLEMFFTSAQNNKLP